MPRSKKKYRQPPKIKIQRYCFYTGLPLPSTVTEARVMHIGMLKTIEHLIPRTITPLRFRNREFGINKVFTMDSMNQVIGHAPLRVKYGLRDHLSQIEFTEYITMEQKHNIYIEAANRYLDQYRHIMPNGKTMVCWNYLSMQGVSEFRTNLFMEYCKLLTMEELYLVLAKENEVPTDHSVWPVEKVDGSTIQPWHLRKIDGLAFMFDKRLMKKWPRDPFHPLENPTSLDLVRYIAEFDPSFDKDYLEWMVSRYTKDNKIPSLADMPHVKESLIKFDQLRRSKNRMKPGDSDITRLVRLTDLDELLHRYE